MTNNPMQDRELLDDVLSAQKHITDIYNTYANECATAGIRDDMLCLLREEHDIQADIYNEMSSRGWYKVQPAEQQKIDQAKQKFQNASM